MRPLKRSELIAAVFLVDALGELVMRRILYIFAAMLAILAGGCSGSLGLSIDSKPSDEQASEIAEIIGSKEEQGERRPMYHWNSDIQDAAEKLAGEEVGPEPQAPNKRYCRVQVTVPGGEVLDVHHDAARDSLMVCRVTVLGSSEPLVYWSGEAPRFDARLTEGQSATQYAFNDIRTGAGVVLRNTPIVVEKIAGDVTMPPESKAIIDAWDAYRKQHREWTERREAAIEKHKERLYAKYGEVLN